jgi:hypothetical protein
VEDISVDLDASANLQATATWNAPFSSADPNSITGNVDLTLALDKKFGVDILPGFGGDIEFYAQGGVDTSLEYTPQHPFVLQGAELTASLGYDYDIDYIVGTASGGENCTVLDVKFQNGQFTGGLELLCQDQSGPDVVVSQHSLRPISRPWLARGAQRRPERKANTAASAPSPIPTGGNQASPCLRIFGA